jgi:5-deoxy-glucuronate isomerase
MKHHLPAGSAAEGPYGLVVTPESAGWTHSALRVLDLPDGGGDHTFATGEFETIVLPLAGSCVVECDGSRFELEGRDDVFSRVSDFAYVPRDARVTVRGSGRFALAGARCEARLEARYGPAITFR